MGVALGALLAAALLVGAAVAHARPADRRHRVLSVCNYLTGPNGGEGNEIWWNGGDGSGKIGMGPWWGNYITATSTYSNGVDTPFADYGIFVSNSRGPGVVDHSYASGMGDAGYY